MYSKTPTWINIIPDMLSCLVNNACIPVCSSYQWQVYFNWIFKIWYFNLKICFYLINYEIPQTKPQGVGGRAMDLF